MSKMWKGPCAELKADYDDHLAQRLHRRASRLLISYTAAHDGRSAEVRQLWKRGEDYYYDVLGRVQGGDVPNLWLNIHLRYTPFDAELFEIASAMILRRAEQLAGRMGGAVKRIEGQLDELAEVMSHVRT